MKYFLLCILCALGAAGSARGQHQLPYQYWQKAEKLAFDGKYDQSLIWYQQAYELVDDIDNIFAANLCNDISSAQYGKGQYLISVRYCHQGLAHLKKQSNAPDSLYFKIYSSLGTMHSALDQRDSSAYYFLAADQVLERNPLVENQIPVYVLHHYLHQGRAVWALHRYHQSISYFTKAKALAEKFRIDSESDYIQSSLAEVHDLLGEHRKALKFRFSAASHPSADLERKQGLLSGIAYTYQRLVIPDSAIYWQNIAWKSHSLHAEKTERYKKQHIHLLLLRSFALRQKEQFDMADKTLFDADRYMKDYGVKDRYFESIILIEKGLIAQHALQFAKAESLFQKAFEVVAASSPDARPGKHHVNPTHPQIALLALQLKGSTLFKRYIQSGKSQYLDSSFICFSDLLILKKSAFLSAADDLQDRLFLSYESHDVFKEAIPVGHEYYKHHPSKSVMQQVFGWFEEANATYLSEVLRQKMEKHEKSNISLAKNYTNVIKEEKKLPLDYIQKQLGKQAVFLSYKWYDDKLYVVIISRDSSSLTSWNVDNNQLKSSLKQLQSQFNSNPGFGKYHGVQPSVDCYKMLIEPLKKWITNKNQLVIVRDWQFNFLPFELLETGSTNESYLAKLFAISYTYSASFFWQHPFDRRLKENQKMSSLIVAPFVREQNLQVKSLPPISKLDDIIQMGGERLWGNQATKSGLLKSGLNYQVIHFATHAFTTDDNPDDSYIQLFPGVDSRLYLNDLYTLPLHSTRLVILSACSAGVGKNLRGEGNISIAHAIAQAGCPSVITTTWEANDQVINYLSIRLHHYMSKGFALDIALKKARLDFFNNDELKKFRHPYYWANFTLIGNNRPILLAEPDSTALTITTITAVMLSIWVTGTIMSKKRRQNTV